MTLSFLSHFYFFFDNLLFIRGKERKNHSIYSESVILFYGQQPHSLNTLVYTIRKFISACPLIIGVTLISFTLMVYYGPDLTYSMVGKNATQEKIDQVRTQLGYDKPFLIRYLKYVEEIATFDFGHSDSSGEKVTTILKRTLPTSLAVTLPGFLIGNLLGIILGLIAAYYRGRIADRLIMAFATMGMSISFLIVLIGFQYIFCSSFALDLFPVQGWSTETLGDYLLHVTVPTLSFVFVGLGYNTRFYRAVLVDEIGKDHIRTLKAYGCGTLSLLFKHVLKNSMIPILTRIVFSIPFILIGGALLVESFFNIPGIGYVTFDAIVTGDLPIVKAVVSLTVIGYVLVLTVIDVLYKTVDPRITLK